MVVLTFVITYGMFMRTDQGLTCVCCFVLLFVGIQYLRDYLHLPQEIVPATLKRPIRAETARPPRPKGQHDRMQSTIGIWWPLTKQLLW